jgi:hypothetical protein
VDLKLKLLKMNNNQIIDKIVEMVCDLPLEEQFAIIEETKIAIQENWDETSSAAWEGYEP